MTREEFNDRYPADFIETVQGFLQDFLEHLEEHEPYATNTMEHIQGVINSLPK
jgi:hypothetical protein